MHDNRPVNRHYERIFNAYESASYEIRERMLRKTSQQCKNYADLHRIADYVYDNECCGGE